MYIDVHFHISEYICNILSCINKWMYYEQTWINNAQTVYL